MNDFDAERNDRLRMKEQTVTLTNQQIIEFAYAHAEHIGPLIHDHDKLTWDAANCYQSVYFLIKELLGTVDSDYLKDHAAVVFFYAGGLSSNGDRLRRPEAESEIVDLAKVRNRRIVVKEIQKNVNLGITEARAILTDEAAAEAAYEALPEHLRRMVDAGDFSGLDADMLAMAERMVEIAGLAEDEPEPN